MTTLPLHAELIDVFPEPIFVFKKNDFSLIWMNSAAEAWTCSSTSTKYGTNIKDLANGFEQLEPILKSTVVTLSTIRGHDLNVLSPDSNLITTSYIAFPFSNGVAVILSPQRSSVEINTDGHKDQAVGMFGRMLAHELKNPLAGIYGAVQLLEHDISEKANLEITELIKSEVKRIGRLADKVENLSSLVSTQNTNLNIHTVLRRAFLLFQNANNTSIEFIENYDPSLPDVHGNSDNLMQVIINLLANATDAVHAHYDKGKIEIQTLYRTGIRKQAQGGRLHSLPVEVKIIDNGIGVPDHLKDNLFQPFTTGKINGQGLGLALVSKIINEHYGIVTYTKNKDKTIFSILLPGTK